MTIVDIQSVSSRTLPATSSTVLFPICRLVSLVSVAKSALDFMTIKSSGGRVMVTSVTPSLIIAGTKLPPLRANILVESEQLPTSMIPVKLKEETLIGSLKVSNSTSLVKSRLNDKSSGGVMSSV